MRPPYRAVARPDSALADLEFNSVRPRRVECEAVAASRGVLVLVWPATRTASRKLAPSVNVTFALSDNVRGELRCVGLGITHPLM